MLPLDTTSRISTMVEIDPEGIVLRITHAAAQLLGWSVGSLVAARVLGKLQAGDPTIELETAEGHGVLLSAVTVEGLGWLLLALPRETRTGEVEPLRPEEMAYRAFFEQAPVGIVHIDGAGVVTFENHALRQIFGEAPADAWIGKQFAAVEKLDGFLMPLVDGLLRQGQAFETGETTYRATDGKQCWLKVAGAPIRGLDNRVEGGVLTFQDVTQKKKAEFVLQQAARDAEAASRMKTALIATISHELRTPAATVRGFASMLAEKLRQSDAPDVGAEVREFVETIVERATDMERLVGDLVEFAQLETGLVRPQTARVDVAAAVQAAVAAAKKVISDGVPLHVIQDKAVHAHADAARFEQQLERVIVNALKFTPSGTVDVSIGESDGYAVVEVRDTGIGIDASFIASIFEPFSQQDETFRRRFEGAGLGLAIVRRAMEQMGGTIRIESRPGEGTTVRMTLPAAPI